MVKKKIGAILTRYQVHHEHITNQRSILKLMGNLVAFNVSKDNFHC